MDTQPEDKKAKRKEQGDLLTRVRDRFKIMYDADHENRLAAMEDMKFANVPGYQWEENMKLERGTRPCYEFNKIRVFGKRVINDMRANRPSAKVRAVEGGDKEVAEINEGLVRNIWNISDGDTIVDYAAEYQVNAGMAAWRIDTEYSDDTAFTQDIKIRPIQNPFSLFCDPAAKDFLKRDAEDWVLTEKISKEEFDRRYGDEENRSDFSGDMQFDDDDEWQDEHTVRIAEYWYKKPHKKEIWQLDDGTVVDSESDEATADDPTLEARIVKRREVFTHKICSCIVSGSKVLEGPHEWAGSQFPFVMVFGEFMVIDGRTYWWGLPRFAKDAQRDYNIARTSISETIAQAPKEYFWATAEQARGLTDQWTDAHKQNLPFKLYNADPKAPGAPVHVGGANVPVALLQQAQIASDELKAITGIFDASLGNQGNESSGRAIYARQQQGEIATFNFQDNMAKGIQRTYELILDLIPHIYDTERELRILGSDGAEDYKRVNQTVYDAETGKTLRINDMASGKYDVTITVGPAFSTLRQEAAETYGQLGQQFPELMQIAGDLVFKSMDLPYAEDIAERLRTILPPQVQEIINEGKDVPPEVQQIMRQAQQAMVQVQQHGELVQAAAAELEQEKALSEKDKADIKAELANLKAARAEFKAEVAESVANLIEREAGLATQGAEIKERAAELQSKAVGLSCAEADVAGEALDTVRSVDDVLASFMGHVTDVLKVLDDKAAELNKKTSRRPVGGTTRREGGRLIADIEFDDGSKSSVSAVRKNGQLQIVNPDSEGSSEA